MEPGKKYIRPRVDKHCMGLATLTIAGPAEHCVERLLALRALGITKFHVLAADWRNLDPALQEHARKSLVQDVLPGVREECARHEAQKQ